MAGMLHNLENNEAILLMYLAGELPAEDRAEVEHMLARDAGMRRELEALRAANEATTAGLGRLDDAEPAGADESSIRRVMREMRRRQLELQARPAVVADEAPQRALPGWVYPIGAAAAAIFILLGLWGVGVIDLPGQDQGQHAGIPIVQEDSTAAAIFPFLGPPNPDEDSSIAQERESQAEQAADGKSADSPDDQSGLMLTL